MQDRLVWLLDRFELRAKVFQAGRLSCAASPPIASTAGVLHILEAGGVRLVSDDGTSLEICEPSAFFYMNPTAHRIEPLDDEVSLVCASFEFGIGQGNPLQAALPELFVLRLADSPALEATLLQLFRESAEDHCGRVAVLDRLAEVTLILILRDLMDRNRLQIGLLAGLSDPKLSRAINAVHAQPEHDWTLEGLADVALMSRAQFAKRFHDVVGITPGTYLSDWRLGLAKTMLLRGSSVQTVALDVGYGSASALSRVFSSRFGMSPTEWRRSARA